MREQDLNDLLALQKKFYRKLTEIMQISKELQDAISRQDQVTLDMLISMRERPVLELQEVFHNISLKRLDLTKEDAARFDELLGGARPEETAEQAVCSQIASNNSLHERLLILDRSLNKTLCGEQSCYQST